MSKLLQRPTSSGPVTAQARFERFGLTENPFPPEPFVNKDSADRRINGRIYEMQIREKECAQIEANFLQNPQRNPSHLRLGYIVDTSYIGRGNGKSAFLVNLQSEINREYCLDISSNVNKCFALYVSPEPGGRTKTFSNFVDLLFGSIINAAIIPRCLAVLRLEAIQSLYPDRVASLPDDDDELVRCLNDPNWFRDARFDDRRVAEQVCSNDELQDLPPEFPLFCDRNLLVPPFVTEREFVDYYEIELRSPRDRFRFVFSHLVRFFIAAGFNGSYVLVDDFERIPDFQSARQKRDFALELRTCLFDGTYLNARLGFFVVLLVLHAGVPRLISDAWTESGLENRAPIASSTQSKHTVPFERLSRRHATLLVRKYLEEYRTPGTPSDSLIPFTEGAIAKIGEISEYNASRILKAAYELLDKAALTDEVTQIDEAFVMEHRYLQDETGGGVPGIRDAESIDLRQEAKGKR